MVKKDLIGSVQRALGILELLSREPNGLLVKEISSRMGVNLSTCYHLLNTLQHEGYIVKDLETGQYRLSGKIGYVSLAQAGYAQLISHLMPHVKELMNESGETSYLSVWDGEEISVAGIYEAENTIKVKSVAVGYSEGNHASALGKTVLAYLPDKDLDLYFKDKNLSAYSPNTITDMTSLKSNLEQIRHQGYGMDREEFMVGVKCIAAPVFDFQGNVTSAVAISLPLMRFKGRENLLISQVRKTADSASRTLSLLGYVSPVGIRRTA